MKSTAFLLLSFFFLTLAAKSSTANQGLAGLHTPVLDVDGDELRTDTEYYILSMIWGAGGGGLTVGRAPANATGCPLDVIQLPFDIMKGRPVTFTPVDYTYGTTIRDSTDLNVKFSPGFFPTCVRSTEWRVWKSSNSNKEWSVRIEGFLGNPGSNTVANKFQIQKDGDFGYKLTFCPTEIGNGDVFCRDLSIYIEHDGTRSLVSNGGPPFKVVFVKAFPESTKYINAA